LSGRKWWEFAILPAVALITIALDQMTKRLVIVWLPLGQSWSPISALERWVSLTLVTNTGAAFGLFPGLGSVFMIVAMVVIVVIVIYYWHMPRGQTLVKVSLGLQLGGAVGNLLDRLQYGHVVDFVDFKVWPVFNVADASIVLGVVLLAYALLREPSEGSSPVLESKGDT
jgi:signal peptidase II